MTLEKFLEERALKKKPFPLKSLLLMYYRGNKADLYCDYFSGFMLLRDWLSPIEFPTRTQEKLFLPLWGYEQQELSVILNCDPRLMQQIFLEILSDEHAN